MTVKQKKQKSKRELWIILGIVAALILIIAVISILPEPAADESPYVLSDGTTVQFRCAYLVANDADALAAFYQTALGFTPANDNVLLQAYSEAAGGAKGVVLTAPGYTGGNAPELCIVSCESASEAGPSRVYDLGYPHLCFEADDIAGTLSAIEAAGGSVISKFSDNAKEVCFYAKDPAGNIIEVHLPTPTVKTPKQYLSLIDSVLRTKLGLPGSSKAKIRFLHVNIVTGDWKKLDTFYQTAFGATEFDDERDYTGEWIETLVAETGIHVTGQHVELPGYAPGCPTLEIFTYEGKTQASPLGLTDLGYTCIGFVTSNVSAATDAAEAAGASIEAVGEGYVLLQDFDGSRILLIQK